MFIISSESSTTTTTMNIPDTIISKNKHQIKVLFARLGEHLKRKSQENSMVGSSTESAPGGEREEAENGSSPLKNTTTTTTSIDDNEVQPSPPYSLPFITFDDDCDEEEKRARAKRVEVIMKLSAEAKAKANIRPLTWARPTFNYPSSTSNSSISSDASHAAMPGKRKNREEGFTSDTFCYPRQPTKEEVQALVDFANTWFPKSKRRNTESGGDDN
jgi:hypothetical protein